ncbi:MAG: queuosine salvage family protein [Candidatus Bruticola sp.]
MNSTVNVLETTEIVRRESKLVYINHEVIKKYCCQWALHPFITPPWDTSVHYDGQGGRLANYILLLDSLNFCFWPDKGFPKWEIKYKGQILGGYQALAASLKRAIEEDINVDDAHWMAQADLKQVRHIFRGIQNGVEIPLLDKRLEHINQSGKVLLENFGGQYSQAIESCGGSAVQLVNLMVEYFPSFRDIHTWNGHEVRILKRAQITPVDIYGSFGGQGLGYFHDLHLLTVFADYKIPQVLRALGILEYAPDLAQKVDNQELLPSGSREEMEIRVGMIWSIEEIRRELESMGVSKMALELDWFLWNLGQEPLPQEKPYHRTRTVFY